MDIRLLYRMFVNFLNYKPKHECVLMVNILCR